MCYGTTSKTNRSECALSLLLRVTALTPRRSWVDGCFDLFHFGHANAFRQARDSPTTTSPHLKPEYRNFVSGPLVGRLSHRWHTHRPGGGARQRSASALLPWRRWPSRGCAGAPPLMRDEERYESVRACKWVDQLVTEVPYSFDTQEQLQE